MDYITRYESPLGGITLAANGALTGYAAGIDRKKQMTPIVIVETFHETSLQET